ncbi:MAG: TonB-dependent receptor [Pseudomonadota bacterium]
MVKGLNGVAVAALIMGWGSAIAQTKGAEDRGENDTIIVTGTKQNLSLQEVDVSAEVFDQDRLDREALFDLNDVLARTPNIVTTGTNGQITIRGLDRFGTGGAGQGVTSNVYLDGAPINNRALIFGSDSVWDVEQIEILRGPQSTVQGRNALAGAVILKTADPTYQPEVKGRIRAAEYGTQQYAGVVSGPIVADQLAFRLATDFQTTDGFTTNALTGDDHNEKENLLVRAKLLAEPQAMPGLRAEFTVDYNDFEGGSRNSVNADRPASDPNFISFDPEDLVSLGRPEATRAETIRFLTEIAYEWTPNLTLRAIGTYEDTDAAEVLGDQSDPSRFPGPAEGDNFTNTTRSAEVRLEYEDDRWTGYIGAYYFDDENDRVIDFQESLFALLPAPFPLDPADSILGISNRFQSETENYAVYAQARFDLNEKLTFDVSFRYDREEFFTTGVVTQNRSVSPDSCQVTIPGALLELPLPTVTLPCLQLVELSTPNTDEPPQSTTFDAFLPRASVFYNVTEDFSVFASAQRGYRAGGAFVQQIGGAAGVVVGTYDPEYLNNYEIGFRSAWLDRRLVLNGNIFYSVLEDQQVQIQGPSGNANDFLTVNAGKSTLYGAEFSADYQVMEGLDIYASLGLLEAEFDDFPFAQPGLPFENLSGNELPNAPGVSFSLGGTYQHVSGMFADASLNTTGERQARSNIENLDESNLGAGITEKLDALSILNMRIGYEAANYTLYAYGINILDARDPLDASIAGISPTTGDLVFVQQPFFTLTEPQTFGVGIDFQF